MTEYDDSPEAHRQYKAKLAGISRWRENAQHPFVDPYEPELRPSDSLSNAGAPPQGYYGRTPAVGFPPQPYPQVQPYAQPQAYYPQPVYPVYPPMAPPFIHPTYPSLYPSSSRTHSRKHGHHHDSGSRSHHVSPSSSSIPLQSAGNLGSMYVPTTSMQSGSTMSRSYSTPPVSGYSAGSYFVPYSGAYPVQQQQLMQPVPPTYPVSAAPVLTPYGYTTTAPIPKYTQSVHSHRSHGHSHRSSRSQSRSYSQSNSAAPPLRVQATSNQTVIMPYNGGHIVIPPAGASVIAGDPFQRSERESNSFLGSLGRRLKKRSSRSSY